MTTERRILDEIARQTFGQDVLVADEERFKRFLSTGFSLFSGAQSAQSTPATVPAPGGFDLGGLLARAYTRANQAAQSFLPSNQEILGGLADIGRDLITPDIPQGFVERAPAPLQPAARVVREVSSPLGLATLPIGGSARVVAGGLAGAAGGATAGQAIGGGAGELIGAVGGGVAGGIPAVQRLAGRGATRLAQSSADLAEGMGRANVGNVLLPRAPAARTAGRTAGVAPDDFFARVRDALGDVEAAPGQPVGARQVYESFLRKFGLTSEQMPEAQFARQLSQGADEASGLRGIPSSRPGEPTARRVQLAWQRPGGGREWLAFIARRTETPVAPPAPPPTVPVQAARATDLPQSSAEAAAQKPRFRLTAERQDLEREVAAARARLPQSSADVALEAEVAAARGGLPPRGPQAPDVAPTPEPDRVATVVGKITQLLRAAPAARQVTAAERRAAIGRGAAIGRARAEPLTDPLSRTRAFLSGQAGQTTSQARFEPLGVRVAGPEGAGELARLTPAESAQALGVTVDDFTALHRRVAEKLPDGFAEKDGQIALVRLLTGNVPTERGQRLLQEVFGPELVAAVRKQRSALSRGIEFGFDLIGLLPKAARSSYDASAPLRQGVIFTLNPRPSRLKAAKESFVLMFRAGFARRGEEIATQSFMDIRDPARNRWAAELYSPGAPKRLFLHDPRKGMALSDKEEFYASRLVERLPELGKDLSPILRTATLPIRVFGKGIRRSELMYGTYLNELRNKIAVRTLEEWERSGKPLLAADVDELIDGINVFTGRGNLGSIGEKVARPLTAAFWSPRLAISRPQSAIVALRGMTVDQILRSAPGARARRELAKDMVAFVTTGVTILGALKAFNVADVEVDPRSTDFGKVRVGNTRFDFWGGFQSTARFVAQVVPAQTKVLSGKQAGRIRQGTPHIGAKGTQVSGDPFAKREVITMRFLRGKLAPGLPTLFWNEFTSETFLGERLDEPSGLIGTTTGPTVDVRTREVFEQFVPLLAVDLIEAYEESGAGGVFYSTVPGSLGVGVQTFGEKEPAQGQNIQGILGR